MHTIAMLFVALALGSVSDQPTDVTTTTVPQLYDGLNTDLPVEVVPDGPAVAPADAAVVPDVRIPQ